MCHKHRPPQNPLLWSSFLVSLFTCMTFTGCSTAPENPSRPEQANSTDIVLKDSNVDLTYTMGHAQHRFSASANALAITAQSWIDKKILEQGPLSPQPYRSLVAQVAQFVEESNRQPADTAPCRASFTIQLRIGQEKRTLVGCRTSEKGSHFGTIARDAEFLLYTGK